VLLLGGAPGDWCAVSACLTTQYKVELMAKTASSPAAGRRATKGATGKSKHTGGKKSDTAKRSKSKKAVPDKTPAARIELGHLKYSKFDKVGDGCSCVRCEMPWFVFITCQRARTHRMLAPRPCVICRQWVKVRTVRYGRA
jgi:hypothetical protein